MFLTNFLGLCILLMCVKFHTQSNHTFSYPYKTDLTHKNPHTQQFKTQRFQTPRSNPQTPFNYFKNPLTQLSPLPTPLN